MARIKTLEFDDRLRQHAERKLEADDITPYMLAKKAGITPLQSIYHLINGGGLNGENTLKLMKYLELEINDL